MGAAATYPFRAMKRGEEIFYPSDGDISALWGRLLSSQASYKKRYGIELQLNPRSDGSGVTVVVTANPNPLATPPKMGRPKKPGARPNTGRRSTEQAFWRTAFLKACDLTPAAAVDFMATCSDFADDALLMYRKFLKKYESEQQQQTEAE